MPPNRPRELICSPRVWRPAFPDWIERHLLGADGLWPHPTPNDRATGLPGDPKHSERYGPPRLGSLAVEDTR